MLYFLFLNETKSVTVNDDKFLYNLRWGEGGYVKISRNQKGKCTLSAPLPDKKSNEIDMTASYPMGEWVIIILDEKQITISLKKS